MSFFYTCDSVFTRVNQKFMREIMLLKLKLFITVICGLFSSRWSLRLFSGLWWCFYVVWF